MSITTESLMGKKEDELLQIAQSEAMKTLLAKADEGGEHPPAAFMIHVVNWSCDYKTACKGWELFKKVRRPISLIEIRDYVKKG